jgi:hypothetical protein
VTDDRLDGAVRAHGAASSAVRLATWNVNHRVGMPRFRPEAATAAVSLDADICCFSEYFPSERAQEFEAALAAAGYGTRLLSHQVAVRANRVLCAAVTYERIGPVQSDVSPNPIDACNVNHLDGRKLATIFIAPYHQRMSERAPKGFALAEHSLA